MFGNDEKREHEKIICNIEAKKVMVAELLKNANLSKIVILKKMVLKLDFIVEINQCDDNENSASIKYFDFEFNKEWCINTTKTIMIKKSDMSFDDVLEAVKSAK